MGFKCNLKGLVVKQIMAAVFSTLLDVVGTDKMYVIRARTVPELYARTETLDPAFMADNYIFTWKDAADAEVPLAEDTPLEKVKFVYLHRRTATTLQ